MEQACMMLKRIHSFSSISSSNGHSLLQGKQTAKVLVSLYVRDKHFSLSRNKSCCLLAFDWSPYIEADQDSSLAARLQLAHIQEKAFVHLYSEQSARCSPSRRSARLHALHQELRQWAENNNSIFTDHHASNVDVHLAFRSIRVLVLRLSADPHHRQQALQDSIIASRLLLKTKESMGVLSSMPIHR